MEKKIYFLFISVLTLPENPHSNFAVASGKL